MRGRETIGYVVAIEGGKVTLNLNDSHKGQVASHRSGVSSVTDVNSFLGVDGGTRILVLRVISLSFLEPREVHKAISKQGQNWALPLRQIVAVVAGWLGRDQKSQLVFTSDSLSTPGLGAEAFPLSSEEMASIVNPSNVDTGTVILGTDCRSTVKLRVKLGDFLGRHVAVLGSTGQGKSCFTAAVIQQLVKLNGPRIIIFDINGEFEAAFKDEQGRNVHLRQDELRITLIGGGKTPFRIPYYALGRHGLSRLLLPSEKTQRPALNFALENLQHVKWFPAVGGAGLANESQASMFDDCRPGDAVKAWSAIDKLRQGSNLTCATEWPNMAALSALVAESYALKTGKNAGSYERDSFHYSNIAPLVTRIRRFIEDPMFSSVVDVSGGRSSGGSGLDWEQEASCLVDDLFGPPKGQTVPWKLHIISLKNIAHDLMPFVLGSLLELFAFQLFKRGQEGTYPSLLVLEEAHHYLRQISEDDGTRSNLAYERLAKEGRKFGLGLWISTQRPSEVSPTVLSQCGTWVVFRLTSENDQRAVANAAEWVERLEVSRISGLPRQQALVFGACIPVPARINAPTAFPTPHSGDPDFSCWNEPPEPEEEDLF